MFRFRRSPVIRIFVTPLTLASFASACSSWSTLQEPVAVSIAQEQPDQVRVTTVHEGVVTLSAPAADSDSLTGILPGTKPEFRWVSYQLDDVAAVERWERAVHGTPGFVATEATLAELCAENVPRVRLTLSDGRVVVLGSPRIEESRVTGLAVESPYFPRHAIALADVTRVEKYTGDKSGILVAAGFGAALLIALTAIAMKDLGDELEEGFGSAFGGGW